MNNFKGYAGIHLVVALGFLLLFPAFLPAQTAAELEALLDSPVVSCSEAARYVAASVGGEASMGGDLSMEGEAGIIPPEAAFEWAMGRGWLPRKAAPDDPIKMGDLSFLLMKAFDLKGGLMYIIFPGPRYAFRAMVSRSFIQGTADPDMKPNGERFLQILGNVLDAAGGES